MYCIEKKNMGKLSFLTVFAMVMVSLLDTSLSLATESACKLHQFDREKNNQGKTYFPASIYLNGSGFSVRRTIDENADGYGFFDDRLLTTGWGVLEFRVGYGSRSSMDVATMFRAGGFLEGHLTAKRIQQQRCNMFYTFFGKQFDKKKLKKTKIFFDMQDKWMRKMIAAYGDDNPYWRHLKYIVAQFDGLVEGYQAAYAEDKSLMKLEVFDFQVLNGVGDMLDLQHALFPEQIPKFISLSKQQLRDFIHRSSFCSALIKVLPGYENLFMSHSSWFVYSSTNRIYKHYDFNSKDPATSAKALSFSSYPGFLESLDDFYLMSSNLVLIQTTNNVFNKSLYNLVKPQSLLAWQRVRLSNHLATNGSYWFQTFKRFNSGTYNNQYMILDLKRINLKQSIMDEALWVVEQIPGLVVGRDVTNILRTGYWPSYNIPFFEEIYSKSGYKEIVSKHGSEFSYQLAPRAEIFRRDADNVKDMRTMKDVMRYNDFTRDPYANGSPWGAICSRGDLDTTNPSPSGCYDTKVSDLEMALERRSFAINGPTKGTGLGAFDWSVFKDAYHWGTPQIYNFSFVEMRPILS